MGNFKFDPEKGTFVPAAQVDAKEKVAGGSKAVSKPAPLSDTDEHFKLIDGIEKQKANIDVDEGEVVFKERSDFTIFQIVDDRTGAVLAYISGYALDINFNLAELKSVQRIEQLIEGIEKLFRSFVVEKIMGKE